MASIEHKRNAALRLLASTGMWRSNYEPPALRVLWQLGIDLPPPHFAGFLSNTALFGTFFGVLWGLLMWAIYWSRQGMPLVVAIGLAFVAGVLFGATMAAYYAYGRRKYGLPLWSDFHPPQ